MTEPKEIDAGLGLLDRQVLDLNGEPVGKVDDVELSHGSPGEEAPTITALLLGPTAYGKRIGGRLGASISGAGQRLSHGDGPIRIPIELVKEIDVSVMLAVEVGELSRLEDVDAWLREHFIARIPGAERASE